MDMWGDGGRHMSCHVSPSPDDGILDGNGGREGGTIKI